MNTITVQLDDSAFSALQAIAEDTDMSLEEAAQVLLIDELREDLESGNSDGRDRVAPPMAPFAFS